MAVGIEVGVEVGVMGGTKTVDTEKLNTMIATIVRRTVKILPMVAPKTVHNSDGILIHIICNKPNVAAVVRIPRDMLINFLFPASLKAVILNCLNRLSRFNARVFNSKADFSGHPGI